MDTGRRRLLQVAVAVLPVQALSSCGKPATSDQASVQPADAPRHRRFLIDSEWKLIDAAVARLIPADALGPGAREANVTLFIDWQLAGPYGRAETWYMQGPWKDGTEQQGYQSKYAPAQLYRTAIKDVDDYCKASFGGKIFAELDGDAQDKVLHGLEKDEIKLANAPGKTWFTMLLQNTVEGFLADPMYGGNRDFIGWRLIGFPGPRYDYTDEIEEYNKRYARAPVGILGRDGTRLVQDGS
jgi:gluconate 2-dehydrogenase gamma chain